MEKSDKTPPALHTYTLPPGPDLARYVHHLRVVSRAPRGTPYRRLPDGAVELIVRTAGEGFSLNVVGTRLAPLRKPSDCHDESFLVRFRPGGAYPFFGVPMAELTDEVVPVEALRPRVALRLQRALEQRTAEARAHAVLGVLEESLENPAFEPASVPAVRRALRLLASAPELPRVSELAARVNLSERHLRRAFEDVVGIAPKAYLRVLRFQRAFKSARKSPLESWVRIAQLHGYYDQSHMIAEFRALSGRTPSALEEALRNT